MQRNKLNILFILILIFGCTQNSKDSKSEQKTVATYIQTDNFQYLDKANFPFEDLSGEAIIGKAVKADDKVLLSYELNITNAFTNSIVISKIDVIDFEKKKVISTFDSTYLNLHFLRPGIENYAEVLEMKNNGFGIANLWLSLTDEKVPKNFFHRINFKIQNENGNVQEASVDLALQEFPEQTKLQIGLPFRKGKWFYVANAHRDARLITEGKATFPQRYAIDWVSLTSNNEFLVDSNENVQSFNTFQADLLAVSNGIVVFTKDGIPDNNPFKDNFDIEITRETVAGNYVVLDIGNGTYAFYGHLTPGSVTVDVGDIVKKGDVIGKLGNSGRSFLPHLHFHLETKSKYPLGGEGIPYTIESFHQLAFFKDEEIPSILASIQMPLEMSKNSIHRTNSLPIGNGVIEFK